MQNCLHPVLIDSTSEIAAEFLGMEVTQGETVCVPSSECQGSGLTLKIDEHPYEIGIISNAGCAQSISKAMLCLGDDDEPLAEDELLDAIGELVNMIAGRVKGKICESGGVVELSTPQVLDLETFSPQGLQFHNSDFQFSIFLTPHCIES